MNKMRLGSLRIRQLALVLGLAVVSLAYASMSSGTTLMAAVTTRELPVYNVDTEEKVVSISFDAAWGDANTKGILDILDQYDVKTTFFLVGFWAEKYPDLVAELAARGHEIGNHSATHPHMSTLSQSQIREELRKCSELVRSITGEAPKLFRPPYGEYNDEVVRVSREEGYECVQWNVDSLDWKNLGAQDMISRCTKNVNPGDIVLFHNDSKYILEALPKILAYYTEKGYKIVPVSQLLLTGDTWIDHTGEQHLSTPEPAPAATATPATQGLSS
ncbi:MAG TPA: polysaccharide deacetylase family protein [Candidatus Ventricola gallistercoris]|nr:polysaccharide deacetylase family protein [Candidatus Ventricola gallistercoris]